MQEKKKQNTQRCRVEAARTPVSMQGTALRDAAQVETAV